MVKRDKRNIGKLVKILPGTMMSGRQGKILGFRGNHHTGCPFVSVFVYQGTTGSVFPIPGNKLQIIFERLSTKGD